MLARYGARTQDEFARDREFLTGDLRTGFLVESENALSVVVQALARLSQDDVTTVTPE